MEARKIGSILIVKGDKLLGIFTERDIVRTVADGVPSNTNLEVVMTKNVETLKPNDPLSKAAYIISEKGFRHIPILDDEGRLVGIISARDISRYYSEFIEAFE
jgi:CBS domain-containing protein